MSPEPLFDTHAHIMGADTIKYPPSEEGRAHPTPPYPVEQLLADMQASGVTRACAVQRWHYYLGDNSYVIDASRPHTNRLATVVMLDGNDPKSPEELREYAEQIPLGALRFANTTGKRLDTSWMNSPTAMQLWEIAAELGIPVTIIFYARQSPYNLPALGMIARMFPSIPIAIDHIGVPHQPVAYLPRMLTDGLGPLPYPGAPDYAISDALKAMRDYPNISFKFTGINIEYLRHSGADPAAFVRHFVNLFGADRLMVGSDIGQTVGPYSRIVSELRASLALLTADERKAVLFDNANRIFGRALAQ